MDAKSRYKRIIYGSVEPSFYEVNKAFLDETNYGTVKAMFVGGFVLAVLLLIICYVFMRDAIALFSAIGIFMGLGIIWMNNRVTTHRQLVPLAYFAAVILGIASAIYSDSVLFPEMPSITVYIMAIVVTVIYLDKPINSMLLLVVAMATQILVSSFYKTNTAILWFDIANSLVCMVLGGMLIVYTRNMYLENIQAEMLFKAQAETDFLTGAFSKGQAEKLIRDYLAENSGAHSALMVLDVDNFKGINDTLGHKQGDEVLRKVGIYLKRCFRDDDIVGRIGGDEFIVLMKDIADDQILAVKAAQIRQRIGSAFASISTERTLTCSIGIAPYDNAGETYENLFFRADKALYRAKELGKNRYEVFSDDLITQAQNKPLILIVDDLEISRAVLANSLEKEYSILHAINGRQAMTYLRKYGTAVRVVILALDMPIMNGYEVIKELQNDDLLKKIPVIVILEKGEKEWLALELGAADVLEKPFNPMVVRKRVAHAVSLAREQQ